MPVTDAPLAKWMFLHLLHGLSQSGYAMAGANELLGELDKLPQQQRKARVLFGTGLLRQALLLNPLDAGLRGLVGQLGAMAAPSPAYAAWLKASAAVLDGQPQVPANEAFGRAWDLPADPDAVLAACREATAPGDVFACLMRLWEMGAWEQTAAGIARFLASPAAPAGAGVLAHAAHAAGDAALRDELLGKALPCPLTMLLRARMAEAADDLSTARALYMEALDAEPALLFLVRHLAQMGRPEAPASVLEGRRIGVGFYTWNKLQVTLDTLASLLDSDIGGAHVALINNGSTAFSRDEFEAGVRAVAGGRQVELIQLPINIGAPAARNWLWHLDSMRDRELFAFLDDDVLLPRTWLRSYVQDMDEMPGTVVVGPQGVNPGSLPTVQYVARYFEKTGKHLIRFTNNAPLVMDFGQYGQRRPCLSVMGCCHLLDKAACARLGVPDFDLRFSPSQVDDLEHDIQVWKAGGRVVYDGRVRVVHRQDAGRAAPLSEASWGHVWGNHYKMERKFTEQELAAVDRATRAADVADLVTAYESVAGQLPSAARSYVGLCVRTLQAAAGENVL